MLPRPQLMRGHRVRTGCKERLATDAAVAAGSDQLKEDGMGLGKGMLLWLLGIPLPIIILLAIFWR
jgi:hypothetical protein